MKGIACGFVCAAKLATSGGSGHSNPFACKQSLGGSCRATRPAVLQLATFWRAAEGTVCACSPTTNKPTTTGGCATTTQARAKAAAHEALWGSSLASLEHYSRL